MELSAVTRADIELYARLLEEQAHLALADGHHDLAAELAAVVARDASSRGARRFELIATAVGAPLRWRTVGGPCCARCSGGRVGACAALDGWPLVDALGRRFDVATWRAQAEASAGVIVPTAPSASVAAAFVGRQLG